MAPWIPFGATREQLPDGYPAYGKGRGAAEAADANPLITRLDPALGDRLLALPYTLALVASTGRPAPSWTGRPDAPSPGSTTRSPTPTGHGRRRATGAVAFSTVWILDSA